MNKRIIGTVAAAVIGVSALTGCADLTRLEQEPIPLNANKFTPESANSAASTESSSAQSDGKGYTVPGLADIIQSNPEPSSSVAASVYTEQPDVKPLEDDYYEPSYEEEPDAQPDTRNDTQPDTHNDASVTEKQDPVSVPEQESSPVRDSAAIPQRIPESSSKRSTASTPKPEVISEPEPAPKPEVSGSSLLEDYTGKWAYNQLSSPLKTMYQRLYNAAQSNISECDISDLGLSESDLYKAYWAFDYDNAQFLELGSGYTYGYLDNNGRREIQRFTIDYSRSPSAVPTSGFLTAAQIAVDKANELSSGYDKIKYIHDWIVNNTVYADNGRSCDTEADGALVYGSGVCESYSKAFMYLAQSLGFECVCVSGDANGGPHMWNMVKLDGNWYHIDLTWDDPVREDGTQTLRYNYFLKSESTFSQDHTIDTPFALPSAPNDY